MYKYVPKGKIYGLLHRRHEGMREEVENEIVKVGRKYIYLTNERRTTKTAPSHYPQNGDEICRDDSYIYYHSKESLEYAKRRDKIAKQLKEKADFSKLCVYELLKIAEIMRIEVEV